jgi:hypothetical protein
MCKFGTTLEYELGPSETGSPFDVFASPLVILISVVY